MKLTLLVALVLIGAFEVCHGAGKCYDKATDHYWDAGTEYSPLGQCLTMICDKKGDSFSGKGCAEFAVLPPCKKTNVDLTKPYPQCCPQADCS